MLGWAVTRNLIAAPTVATSIQQAGKKKRILKAQTGNAVRLANRSGDVWTTTWADDDNLYTVSDDTPIDKPSPSGHSKPQPQLSMLGL